MRGRTSSRGGNTETAYRLRRECAESTEVAERVRRQYEQREHSTNVLFKYGHSTDVRDVQEDFKVRQFRLWQVIRFLHSHRALQKLPKKEDVANTRRQETTTIRATVSFFLPPLLPLLLLLFAAGGSLLRNVHMERFTVFFRRTIDFSRSRCRWRWRSSMLRTFRLGRPR